MLCDGEDQRVVGGKNHSVGRATDTEGCDDRGSVAVDRNGAASSSCKEVEG